MGGIVSSIFGGGGGGCVSAPAPVTQSVSDPFGAMGGRTQYGQSLMNLMNNPSLAMSMPGYQQTLQQGTRVSQAGAAAAGTLQSGGQSAALQNLGQNTFSSYFNDLYNKYGTLSGATSQTPSGAAAVSSQSALGSASLSNQIQQQNASLGLGTAALGGYAAYSSGLFGSAAVDSTAAALGGGGSFLGEAFMLSDIRAKENIKLIDKLPSGLNIYTFEYKREFKDVAGHGKFTGVMAQEAEQIIPEAVVTLSNGYKAVDYSLIH